AKGGTTTSSTGVTTSSSASPKTEQEDRRELKLVLEILSGGRAVINSEGTTNYKEESSAPFRLDSTRKL
ncbi:unnamed protein product, partial [Amoebophrya sp. A25]